MILSFYNPETDDLEKSYLANNYAVGTTSIQVKNNDRFAANDRIMIGEQGQEKTEVVTVSAINADGITVTVGATVFSHSANDPVYKLRFDQVKFYRSTTTSTGTFTVISTQNLDVDNADLITKYDDTTGTTAYFYKMTAYHSISTLESAFSDVIGGSGWRREQVGNIIDEILKEVGDPTETHISRQELLGYFNDVNDDLQLSAAKPFDFLHSRTALARTANQNYLAFPVDSNGKQTMWKFDYMDYNYTDSTTTPATDVTYTLTVIPEPEFRNSYQDNTIDSTTVDNYIQVVCLDTSVNRFRFDKAPVTTQSNVFYLHYWKYFDNITSEGQVIETPTPKIYKTYCKAMFYRKRAIADVTLRSYADTLMQEYRVEKSNFKVTNRKDAGTPRGFRPLNSVIRGYRR